MHVFINTLQVWRANIDIIDIQPVFNHYKAITYMCAYFSETEDETSATMKQTARET